jgi:hypothetical protein
VTSEGLYKKIPCKNVLDNKISTKKALYIIIKFFKFFSSADLWRTLLSIHILFQVSSLLMIHYTDKKENQIFLIYKVIHNGAVAYMTNGLLIYGEIFAHFLIY